MTKQHERLLADMTAPIPIKMYVATRDEFRKYGGFKVDVKSAALGSPACGAMMKGFSCTMVKDHKGLWHVAHSDHPARDRAVLAWERDEGTREGGRQKDVLH